MKVYGIRSLKNKFGDYRYKCDRCASTYWLISELRREYLTNLLVCPICEDKQVCGLLDPNAKPVVTNEFRVIKK